MGKPKGITKTEIRRGCIGSKKGWAFDVYYGREYPNLISALYKTREEVVEKLDDYVKTGKFDTYGSAE